MSLQDKAVGLWEETFKAEITASLILKDALKPFIEPVSDVYECGIEVVTLPSGIHNHIHLKMAALFLKRALSDLRGVWHLLSTGYTSQAGSLAAALTPGDFKARWNELYSAYEWLCKIKHPTLASVSHDASSTKLDEETYVVAAIPDLRTEDLPNKFTILAIIVARLHSAIRSFALEAGCGGEDSRVIKWSARLNSIIPNSMKAMKTINGLRLPFVLTAKHD